MTILILWHVQFWPRADGRRPGRENCSVQVVTPGIPFKPLSANLPSRRQPNQTQIPEFWPPGSNNWQSSTRVFTLKPFPTPEILNGPTDDSWLKFHAFGPLSLRNRRILASSFEATL